MPLPSAPQSGTPARMNKLLRRSLPFVCLLASVLLPLLERKIVMSRPLLVVIAPRLTVRPSRRSLGVVCLFPHPPGQDHIASQLPFSSKAKTLSPLPAVSPWLSSFTEHLTVTLPFTFVPSHFSGVTLGPPLEAIAPRTGPCVFLGSSWQEKGPHSSF